ncbi:TIGR02281 family clan AA aspartic protease [Aureimonas sp. AU22]|jgi:aspartyl protease family protein|uniref:retropepsin-like aspartic protease family protein n=1 Tax=Aureimonas sp. AU22 TaxID=1638162 RepID=UPI000782125D|nr:TIGR02281 family clan AA aspartic protease [Aureimonas sp. AU22]
MRSGTTLVVLLAVIGVALLALTWGGGEVLGLDDDAFASLVYMGLWTTLLGSGLLVAFRGRWGEAAKGAAIWIAAFAVLIAAYAFGPEIRSVGDRMMAVLLPGRAVSVGGPDGQVMVARGDGSHFALDAEVNGERVHFLVDTGASLIALDRDTAAAIGIDLAALRYTARIRTANGDTVAAPVMLDRVRVGSIERRRVPAVVTQGDGIGVNLLGMSFLGTLSSLDFRGDRLVLSD